MRRIILPVLFVVALSGTAFADATTATPQGDPPAAAALPTPPTIADNVSDSTIVCKWTSVIGSRLSDRLCLPKRRWKQMHQDGQDFMRNIGERGEGGQDRGI